VDRRRALDSLKKAAQARAHEKAEELERLHENLRMVREQAEHTNRCRNRTVFVVNASGVYSARDGRPIVDPHQTLADEWYFDFMSDGLTPRGLLHDPKPQAFYPRAPPYLMAFSRDRCPLAVFFWALGDERAYPWNDFGPERLDPQRVQELESWGDG